MDTFINNLLAHFSEVAAQQTKINAYKAPNCNAPYQGTYVRVNRDADENITEYLRGEIALVISTSDSGAVMAVALPDAAKKTVLFNMLRANFTVCDSASVDQTLKTKLHMVADIYFRDACKLILGKTPMPSAVPAFKYGGFVMKQGTPARIGVVVSAGAPNTMHVAWADTIMCWELVATSELQQASMVDLGVLPPQTQDRLMRLHGYIVCKYTAKYCAAGSDCALPFEHYVARALFSNNTQPDSSSSATVMAGTAKKPKKRSASTIHDSECELGLGPAADASHQTSSTSTARKPDAADAKTDDAESFDPVSLLGKRRKRLAGALNK